MLARGLALLLVLGACSAGGGRSATEPPPVARVTMCETAQDCAPREVCESPEVESWNRCGAEKRSECPAGTIGDACGRCFLACDETHACPAGRSCGRAGYCVSPRRCITLVPPPP